MDVPSFVIKYFLGCIQGGDVPKQNHSIQMDSVSPNQNNKIIGFSISKAKLVKTCEPFSSAVSPSSFHFPDI
jgi:hypothetical protein